MRGGADTHYMRGINRQKTRCGLWYHSETFLRKNTNKQYIFTLCQLLKVVLTESLKNTSWSLGDGDGLSLPRGDARRGDRGGAAVLRHTTEDLTWHKKTCTLESLGPTCRYLKEVEDKAPSCVPQSESQRQYFGILCPTWLPRSPLGPSSAWVQRLQPCWRESCGCLHCDYRHCGQTLSWAAGDSIVVPVNYNP